MPNPPKPIELKRKLGNPGRRKLPDPSQTMALEPASGSPPVPIALGTPGGALWCALHVQAPWLARVDHLKVEELCHLKDEVDEMRRRISDDGLTLTEPIVTPAGHVVGERLIPHPLLKELRAAQKLLADLGSALGLDPTSRSRLGLAEVKAKSILATLQEQEHRPANVIDIPDLAAD